MVNDNEWVKLIGGAFAFMDAPFAVHPKDEERAYDYRERAKLAGLNWSDVERHMNLYMDSQSIEPAAQNKQMARAREFFQGSLD